MRISIPSNVSFILNRLHLNGYESYVCGGCVRDSLLSRTPSDWDICTSATPKEVVELFNSSGYKVIPTGLRHGTVTVVIAGEHFEVTTFRIDGDYSDNRRPDSVAFTDDIVKDLSRRDFTINALAFNHIKGLVDPFGGSEDLEHRIIGCVGSPDDRFQEDGLRVLRAVRFCSQLGFEIDEKTEKSIMKNKELLDKISKERIRDEFNKILLSKVPSYGVKKLHCLGLLDFIMPELSNCYGFDQHNPHHYEDVFGHTMTVVNNLESKLELRLSGLFHDIGKPSTLTIDENNTGHFYLHHRESAKICREVMTRLKYSNREIEYVSELVYYHMTKYKNINPSSAKRFINRIGEDKLDDLFKLFVADRVSGVPPYEFDDIYRLKFKCEKILFEKQPLGTKDLAVNGYDLMKIGIPQGKKMGGILNKLLEMVLEDPELNTKDTLLEISWGLKLL